MLPHILPQVLLGSEAAQLEQYPLRVEVAHCAVYHLHSPVSRYPVQFPQPPLEVAEVALDDGVVVAAALARHAAYNPVTPGELQVLAAPVEDSLVAVDHHPLRHSPAPLQALKHLPDHRPRVAGRHAVRQDHIIVQVHYRGQVQPPAAKHPHLRNVRHQLLQRSGRAEPLLQQVGGMARAAPDTAVTLAAVDALQAHRAHAVVHRLEVHAHASAAQHSRHLAAAVLAAALMEYLRYQRVSALMARPRAQGAQAVVVRAAAHPRHAQEQLQGILLAEALHGPHFP